MWQPTLLALDFPCNQLLHPKLVPSCHLKFCTLLCPWSMCVLMIICWKQQIVISQSYKWISTINTEHDIRPLLEKQGSLQCCLLFRAVGSVGVRNLMPCKTLIKTSVESPSSLPHVMLSDPFSKCRVEPFVKNTHNHTQIQQNTDWESQDSLRRAQIPSYNRQAEMLEDTGRGKKTQIWVRRWSDDS